MCLIILTKDASLAGLLVPPCGINGHAAISYALFCQLCHVRGIVAGIKNKAMGYKESIFLIN
jgi:hypothetical protein